MEIKEIHCKVCNHILDTRKENVYQTRVESAIFHNANIYDATDCPYCGCQNLLKERYEKARVK